MPQIINTNIASLNAQRNLDKSQSANQQALQRLSSGLRINSAKDDAAGLAISTRFTSQIKGLDVAVRNAGDGIALAQTAEGALGSINESLQRIRELAVQSANATNSDVDREALQAEVDQLVSEISRTAEETDFNGRKLLDGSFSATFQVGANAGQTVDVSIAELTADKLGSSSQSGVSAIGTDDSLSNGDLIINGVAIGASKAEDDTSSTENNAASAISKVAAINRYSDETGVTAQVNENTVAGAEMTATALTGSISLNGVSIDIQTSSDGATTRASVVEAINAVSEQTGITATDSGLDNGGVELNAADGRNISLSFSNVTSSATGLAAAGTYEGGYTLVADGDVKQVDIDGGNGTGNGDIERSGLVAGSYDRATASVTSEAQVSAQRGVGLTSTQEGTAINDRNATAANLQSGAAAVNGVTYSVAVDGETVSSGALANSAELADLATAINGSSDSVIAYEEAAIQISAVDAATTGISVGGVSAAFAAGASLDEIADSINNTDFSGADMDVSAEFDGTNINVTIKNYSANAIQVDSTANTFTFGVIQNDGTTVVGSGASAAAGTPDFVSGNLKVESKDGSDIEVQLSALTAGSNFIAGTNQTIAVEGVNGLEDGDLTINGVAIKAAAVEADTASATLSSDGKTIVNSSKELSAIAVAEAINRVSEETGVSATVNATKVVGGDGSTLDGLDLDPTTGPFEVGDAAGLYINGVSIGDVTLQADSSGDIDADKARADAINIINQKAGQTGVIAEDNGVSITLTAADGRNVSVAINDKSGSDDSIGAVFGLDATASGNGIGESTFSSGTVAAAGSSSEASTYETTYSTVRLSSASEIEVSGGSNGNTDLEALGFSVGTYGGGEDGQFLKDIDISTFEGAQAAITAIDNAIGQVASQRADLGAIQNRLESTVSNLQVTSENLNAANSRIQDADFAAETAELSRTQVLQQAGISVLAQANAAGQQVLSLLG